MQSFTMKKIVTTYNIFVKFALLSLLFSRGF